MMETTRKYPIGIQTFSRIRREGLVYVDKTDLVWQLAHYSPYIFLSRPRRFGKSLLTSTLESYFRGEKELFEGLKIMQFEKEWKEYPVIRLSLSMAKNQDSSEALRDRLLLLLKPYREMYGSDPEEKTPGGVLAGLISRAYKNTGKQVVVLIDEYDAPMLDVLHTPRKNKCAGGRTDMVVWMPDTIYVFEMKVKGTVQEALEQINSNSYAIPYQTDGRQVVKVGVKFDAEKRVPVDWIIS